jgi:hypothetical protein
MFQSKWVRIPIKIILIWLAITLYFYFQHPVVYRCLDFDASIPIGDAQLLIHEIRVTNLDEDQQYGYGWMDNEETPWRLKIIQRMHELGLPINWQPAVFKALTFYSWPPLADEFWTYKIYGTLIFPEDIDFDIDEYEPDRFSLYIYPALKGGSGRLWEETLRNAVMVYAYGKIEPQQLDNPLMINLVDKENDRTTRLVMTPRWQKERPINRVSSINQYKSPAEPVRSIMYKIYSERPQQALDCVLTELRNNFPLPTPNERLKGQDIDVVGRLSWVDVYKDYLSVYRVDVEVGKPSENNFIPVQKLTLYTIIDQDGNHKLIDWKSAD